MQPDAGLIQDIQHIDQLGTNLSGQTDTLTLSARQSDRRTVQRKIIQSHIQQELQAGTYFLQDFRRNQTLLFFQKILHMTHPVIQFTDIHGGQFVNILVMNTEMQSLLVQTCPLTFRAHIRLSKLFRPFLCGSRSLLFLHHLDILDNPFIHYKIIGSGMNQCTLDFQTLIASVQDFIDGIFRQFTYRRFQRGLITFQQGFQLPENHHILVFSQRGDRSFIDRQRTVGNHLVLVNQIDVPQSLATRTCSLWRIERKIMRCRFLIGQSCHRTHQSLTIVTYTLGLCIQYHEKAVALLHGCRHTLLQPAVFLVRHHRFVNHYLNVMVLVTVQFHAMDNLLDFPVYPDIKVTLLTHLLEQLFIMSFTCPNQRSQNKNSFSLIIPMNQIQNLLFGVLHHLLSRQIRISRACPREQQTQIIIYFCSGSYRRTWILIGRLLLDGNHRTQSRNLIHIRTFHSSQEITGIRRKGLDITPLSFHKQGVEGQGRFSTST